MPSSQSRAGTLWVLWLLLFVGCDGSPQDGSTAKATGTPTPIALPGPAESETEAPDAIRPTVVFLGDSLTAGFGLAASKAFPIVVKQALRDKGVEVNVVNAGVSGDTTAGGLRRVDWLLRQSPDVMVVALGGNDGLRGVDLDSTETNLRNILTKALAAETQVILGGMLIPPNYGPEYTERFARLYPVLAEEFDVALIPFLLEGVAGHPALNQADGIHPTAEGQQRVAEVVLPYVEAALTVVAATESAGLDQ